MPQVRKESVRQRILVSADRLFARKSYVDTTLAAIAKDAGTSVGNMYVYFSSKVQIFFTLYTPWFQEQLQQLQQKASKIRDPDDRLEFILQGYWFDIPNSRRGFSNNLIQAISAAGPGERTFELFWWSSEKLIDMIRDCLPPERHGLLGGRILSDILVMAYGGYSINYKFNFPPERVRLAARLMSDLLRGAPVKARKLDPMVGFQAPAGVPKQDSLQSAVVAPPARKTASRARQL